MAGGSRIDMSWIDDLDDYVEDLRWDAQEAADAATNYARDAIVAYAKSKPNWVHLADDIQKWSIDGSLVIGFLHDDMASQAFAIEYGNLETPPDPLFRSLSDVSERTAKKFRDEMMARRPIRVPGVKR